MSKPANSFTIERTDQQGGAWLVEWTARVVSDHPDHNFPEAQSYFAFTALEHARTFIGKLRGLDRIRMRKYSDTSYSYEY